MIEDFPVPGARLHTEVRGSGPLLLLIHGGNGDSASFDGIVGPLAEHFTVLTYVRRGFVRSPLAALRSTPSASPSTSRTRPR